NGQASDNDLQGDLRSLESSDTEVFDAAWGRLVAMGSKAVDGVLTGWGSLDATGRVARARLLEELAPELSASYLATLDIDPIAEQAPAFGARLLAPLLDPVETPEAQARVALARALGSPALARDGVPFLTALASTDPSRQVRIVALAALADSAEPSAAPALDGLLVELPDGERPAAARALSKLPAARARVVRRVQQALLDDAAEGTSPEEVEAVRHHATLAALASGYGRALAELPEGGVSVRDRAPFLLLRSHPATLVRAMGRLSLDMFLARLVELGEEQRASEVLYALSQDGLSPREVIYRRARLSLAGMGDAEAARDLAQELLRSASLSSSAIDRGWRHYALVLRGAAEFALEEIDVSRATFREAAGILRGLIAEREDLRPSLSGPGDHPVAAIGGALVVDRIVELGLVEVWLSLCALADGEPIASLEVLSPLRRAHVLLLTAQLQGQRTDSVFDARSLDDFLERDLGPRRLLLVSRELPGGREGRFLDLQLKLGEALATVIPQEVMGFERAPVQDPTIGDALLDDERFGLLQAIAGAELEAAQRSWSTRLVELKAQALREDDPSFYLSDIQRQEPEFQRLSGLFRRKMDAGELLRGLSAAERQDASRRGELNPQLRELRTPSLYALTLAGELRADGRSAESRKLAERMLRDLRRDTGQSVLWQEWISARLELVIASAWMDEDKPRAAETAGLGAVRRLEAMERTLRDLIKPGDDPGRVLGIQRQVRQTEQMRADALLSLAVNANVRGKDPERALRFFEQAFEIDQREFMRLLLACYRARSGRTEEARSVLRGVQPTPALYYNLACTHALLGEPDKALDYLQRELEENQPTPGALARQRGWAREDPDLASLRGNPRFERLTRLD
ncbi:MAG: tetratricopeptide (TPR) repeat protein, partial [Gammaproteobacteria bacterium]